jgi:hypothetical protein
VPPVWDRVVILEIGALVLLTLVTVALLWPLAKAALRQRRVHAWPQVSGVVTDQRLRQDQHGYFAEHEVRFYVAGREAKTWCGSPDRTAITGDDSIHSRPDRAAQKILDRHPVGTSIGVRVNPEDHGEAYRVERELPLTLIASLAGAFFLGLIGTVIWVLFLP